MLTNSTKQGPSREATSSLAQKEIPQMVSFSARMGSTLVFVLDESCANSSILFPEILKLLKKVFRKCLPKFQKNTLS
jgi:hypothetical protein